MSAACASAAAPRVAAVPSAFRSRSTRVGRSNASSARRASTVVVAAAAVARAAVADKTPLIKVCGVTTAADATQAAAAGATYVGMILAPKGKRHISLEVAAEVAAAARAGGAIPVGVFVDESAEEIKAACAAVGIDHAQLHGDGSRRALTDLPLSIKAIYVVNATAEGAIVTPMPGDEEALMKQRKEELSGEKGWKAAVDWVHGPRRTIDWLLVDGESAGSGQAFDWANLKVPRGCSRKGWILAGGLTPENVSEAIMTARPTAVDVASGVTMEGGVMKDPVKVEAFVANVAAAATKLV